jgi:hypothetical protein
MPDLPPNAIIVEALFTLILPAFVLAALALALIEWFAGAKQAPAAAALGVIFAYALGPTLGHWGYDGIKDPLEYWFSNTLILMPGDSPWNRLPWAALAALCVGRLTRGADAPAADVWLIRGAVSFAIAWWVMPEHVHALGVWVAPAFGGAILLNWMVLECLARKPSDGSVPMALVLCFFVASMVLLYAGIARFSGAAIVLGSAFAGLALVGYVRRADTSGSAGGGAVMLPALLLAGNRETVVADVPLVAYVLTGISPLTLAAALPFAHWPWYARILLRLALIALPLGIALALTMQAEPPAFE